MIAMLERKPLGQLLLSRGLIQSEQLDRALLEQSRTGNQKLLGEVFVDLHICSEDQIVESLAQAYGVPYARVSPKIADPKVISVLPKEFLEKHQVLPLYLVEGVLTVAVPEPANVFLLEEIERQSTHRVQVVAATATDIKSTLQAYLPNDKVFVIDDIIEEVKPEAFSLIEQTTAEVSGPEMAAGDSPVIKLVNYVIYNGVKELASDIHIEPGNEVLRIRYRIDGHLVEKLRPPFQMHTAVADRIKIMAGLNVGQRDLPQEGSIHVLLEKRPIDLRVITMPGKSGEKVVIRIVDNEKASLNLEKLGFGYDTLKAWRKLIHLPHGIVLVTGPGGCGKTTTLYSVLHELNREDRNICTVEDPIEYALAGVNQFQVNEKTGFTYPVALQSLLRQDPDTVMIGALRDGETAKLAAQAAMAGHLVLSALHTNDAPSAIMRLYNLGLEPYLVGATLAGVMSQRLVRKLCQNCKESYEPTLNERRQIEKISGPVDRLFKPRGCSRCRELGFSGRIGIYELLVCDDAWIDRISGAATLNDLRDLSRRQGMRTLRADGIEKVKSGITTLEEVVRVTA
jgi:type IV pilus assembly protein PilB